MYGLVLLLAIAAQSADPYAPPEIRKYSECTCPADASHEVTLSGYVVDAKIILGADRRSVEDRMATIFDVKSSSDASVSGRTAVWHNIDEDACGVSFDYGKKYTVYARRDDDGELETDSCLMGG
ncbi:hypothetical protein [Hyphococcus sp.]|jgi:hypothetical protein|uniref:hypothetical protein n=1 Tax=Hyphococcus sp. TaxID=2038636 RepID=UPI003D0DB769